jgi:hypothetical protein
MFLIKPVLDGVNRLVERAGVLGTVAIGLVAIVGLLAWGVHAQAIVRLDTITSTLAAHEKARLEHDTAAKARGEAILRAAEKQTDLLGRLVVLETERCVQTQIDEEAKRTCLRAGLTLQQLKLPPSE